MAQIADDCCVAASPPSAPVPAPTRSTRHALDALVEANVRAQFARLLESEPVQTVLASGRPLSLHGCVYDLASGHLTTLVEHLSPQEHAP
jgi:carbonic anhydrase